VDISEVESYEQTVLKKWQFNKPSIYKGLDHRSCSICYWSSNL